ncbi:uncharacterized protein LOC130763551 isoform X2 [Actinidia eriantha]|uniref:uncharacterized protein LOC130763551 isoform X2 n=1 Tax=Actinidia eriantha TaxID=165200 RepID=UPI00258DB7D5|nr:uncharacterized protein LOC130763551 isoform X2 [Actinidia eriantha]
MLIWRLCPRCWKLMLANRKLVLFFTHWVGTWIARTMGGSFLCHMKDRQVSIGLVAALNSHNPFLNPYEEFQVDFMLLRKLTGWIPLPVVVVVFVHLRLRFFNAQKGLSIKHRLWKLIEIVFLLSPGIMADLAHILEAHDKVAVAEKTQIYVPYNILPLDPDSANQAIMRYLEIQAAILALHSTRGLQ